MKKEKTFVAVIILVCEIFMILYFAGKIDFEVDVDHGAIDEDNDSFFSLNGSEYTPHRIRGKYYLNLNRRICHALRNSRNILLENVITMSAISPIRNFIVSEFYSSDDETSLGDYSIVSKIRLNELLVSSNKTAFFYSTEYVNFARSISVAINSWQINIRRKLPIFFLLQFSKQSLFHGNVFSITKENYPIIPLI